jgi:hypothetical protein
MYEWKHSGDSPIVLLGVGLTPYCLVCIVGRPEPARNKTTYKNLYNYTPK